MSKIVIDIPEEDYKELKEQDKNGFIHHCGNKWKIAVLDGTPLDDIKAEIRQKSLGGIGSDRFIFTDNVIRIIDKHISGKKRVNDTKIC